MGIIPYLRSLVVWNCAPKVNQALLAILPMREETDWGEACTPMVGTGSLSTVCSPAAILLTALISAKACPYLCLKELGDKKCL